MTPDFPGKPDGDKPAPPEADPVESFAALTLEELDALPETMPPTVQAPREADSAPSRSFTGTEKRVAAASVLGGGVLMVLVLMTRTGASVSPAVQPSPAPVPVRAAAVVLASNVAMAPAWTEENRETWIAGARRAAAFEVQADKPVSVWMRTVRPSLVVRCEAKVLDVFVFTDSAARIEPQTIDHTVTLQFDGGEEMSTRWPDADTHDALFAPDGASFAKRLASAQILRFGFTPHNAEPVTMQFTVAGLAPLLARAAKEGCKAAAF
jgi:hypothetical protein